MPTIVMQLKNDEQLVFDLAGSFWPTTRAGNAGFGLAAGAGLGVNQDQNELLVRGEAGDASCSAKATLVTATRSAAATTGMRRWCFI
jgi:hypothetical protein